MDIEKDKELWDCVDRIKESALDLWGYHYELGNGTNIKQLSNFSNALKEGINKYITLLERYK